MADNAAAPLELYKLYLATAEAVSDRRARANVWMVSVNSALIALSGAFDLAGGQEGESAALGLWQFAVPLAGIIVCVTWAALLSSYSKLNKAKFTLLHELEADLPVRLFEREQAIYRSLGRRRLSGVESAVPWSFAALYLLLILAGAYGR